MKDTKPCRGPPRPTVTVRSAATTNANTNTDFVNVIFFCRSFFPPLIIFRLLFPLLSLSSLLYQRRFLLPLFLCTVFPPLLSLIWILWPCLSEWTLFSETAIGQLPLFSPRTSRPADRHIQTPPGGHHCGVSPGPP